MPSLKRAFWRLVCSGAFLLAESVANLAQAQSAWAVVVECPELSAEQRAELEVRHLVELQALPGTPATLVIRCSEDAVEGSWQRQGVTLSKRSVTRAEGDDVVELGHGIASILIGVREVHAADSSLTSSSAEKEGAPPSPPPDPSREGVAPATSGETATSTNASLKEDTPQVADAEREGAQQAEASPVSTTSPAPRRLPWSVGVGASAHYLGTQVPLTLGPVFEGTVRILDSVGVQAALSAEWGMGRADGFGVREIAPSVHADLMVTPWLSVLVGPVLSVLLVKGNTEVTSQRSVATTGGVEILLRGSTPWRGAGAFGAVGLRALGRAREVRVDGEIALSIPQWQAGMMLGFQWGGENKK